MESDRKNSLTSLLHGRLAERARVLDDVPPASSGRYVLYWLHSTLRGHENPALEVAIELARGLGVPLFVYQALSDRHPYANDRHWRFALEGARDLRDELRDRGIGYAFHLERPATRGPHLLTLAAEASVIVTDDVPVEPLRTWTRALASRIRAPVCAVDTACVLPMRVVGKAYDRAFAFRRATEKRRNANLAAAPTAREAPCAAFVPELPFEPFDLDGDLATAIAECEIDHSVAPVPHTRGGSRAGYARWSRFVESGVLTRYARQRNDALRDGTSRMSAYLHWGMVSPFRLARDAMQRAKDGDSGAEKYLDELLIWRELAWCFCAHRDDVDSFAAIPAWARTTLSEHEADARETIDLETLSRGRTGDALWDACQRSLVVHGELHNNVRMTWGKAFLRWFEDPQGALTAAIDLNHRYALDGRDPSSYGGLLWCFGQFDRPFEPPVEIFGTVRPRPTEAHARRLDVARYAARSSAPAFTFAPRVAVVGAGISGLACARVLVDHGLDVRVFDKARGPGGRLASRRASFATFDLGAPVFAARDARFRRHVDAWVARGFVSEWGEGYVGVPRMSALTRALSDELEVVPGCRIATIERRGARYYLHPEAEEAESLGPFDRVVITTPVPQAMPLLACAPGLQRALERVEYEHGMTWAFAFDQSLVWPTDILRQPHESLQSVVRESAKPGRAGEVLVGHASAEFARRRFEDDEDEVLKALFSSLEDVAGESLPEPVHALRHRWRYARVRHGIPDACVVDDARGVFYASDACSVKNDREVERAWLSGVAAAGRLLGALADEQVATEQSDLFS